MIGRTITGAALAVLLVSAASGQIVPGGRPQPAPGVPAPPPGPPSTVQKDLDTKFRALMVGRWTISFVQMNMQYTNDIVYRGDGTFSGTQTVRQYGEMQYPLQGTWSVQGIDDKTFTLQLFVSSGSGGSGTDSLTVIDQNTLYAASVQQNAYRLP